MRRGGQSHETEAGRGLNRPARPDGDSPPASIELAEALEQLRVANEELRHQQALLDEAGAEVAAQMQRYRELFDFAPDGYLVTSRSGIVVEANLAATHMLGFHGAQLIGKPLIVYVVAPDRRRLMRLLRDAAAESGVQETELLMQSRQHEVVPVSVRVSAAHDDEQEQLRWLLRDVRRRREAEQQVEDSLRRERDAAARLRDLDSVKNAFLLAVSHDLRGPVMAIVGLARSLTDPAIAPERRERLAASIAANAARVERVQRNLVDLDRLARHAVVLQESTVDVGALVAASVAAADTSDRPVSTRIDVATATLDAAVAGRILDNLLSNAVNHTPPGTPVDVAAEAVRDGVLFSVADHGPGVPAELHEAIFEPFGGHKPGRNGEAPWGTGVGLHLVARFAELHGGRAWVEPTADGGATFRVLLHGRT